MVRALGTAATQRTKFAHQSPTWLLARAPHQVGDVEPPSLRKHLCDSFSLIFFLLKTQHSTAPTQMDKSKTSPLIPNLAKGDL